MSRRRLWLAMMIGGSAAAIVGAFLGTTLLLLGLLAGGPFASGSVLMGGSVVALSLGLGLSVAYHGWAGWRGRSTRSFRPRSLWWLWTVLGLAVGLGSAIGAWGEANAWLLLPIHVVAMALPPLILVALSGRALRDGGVSWRGVIGGLGGGGLVAVPIAFALEAALVISLGVIAGALVMTIPGGQERVAALALELQDPALLAEPTRLSDLVLNPFFLTALVSFVGVAAPLIEEAVKTLAVGIVGAWARPAPARAFVWGVASGAGFAIAENLLNGAALGQGFWLGVALSRMAASTMHCFTGGLVGWGWGQLWASGRARRFLFSLAGAIALHAFWNISAVTSVILTAAGQREGAQAAWQSMGAIAGPVFAAVLGAAALALAIALPLAASRLARAQTDTITQDDEGDSPCGKGATVSSDQDSAGLPALGPREQSRPVTSLD